MKKLILLLVMFLLIPLAFATYGEDAEFGDNYSTTASDYIAFDRFNRPDNSNIGNLETGQAWQQEGQGNEVISGGMLYIQDGEAADSRPKFAQSLEAEYTDVFTVDIIMFHPSGTSASHGMKLRRADGFDLSQLMTIWVGGAGDRLRYTDESGGGDHDTTPTFNWVDVTDTTVLVRLVVDTSETVNMTIFNFSVTDGIITLDTLGILEDVSSGYADDFGFPVIVGDRRNDLWVTEIAIYNGTTRPAGTPPPPPTVIINNTKPIITINYPDNFTTIGNTTVYPLLIYGNVTVQNGTLANVTINSTNWNNIGNRSFFNFTMNGTINEGTHFYEIFSNSTHGNITRELIQFTVDLTPPTFQSSLSNNDTIIYAYNNLTFIINVSDTEKVYSFNVSTPEGYVVSFTGVNTTKYLFNGSINVSNYGIGKHTLSSESCDAHTNNKIKDWEEHIGIDQRITYDFGNDYLFIRPLDTSTIEEVTTKKLKDRYTFTYNKEDNNKKEDFTFIVSSSQYIDIIGNSDKYKGWLVIPKLKKWIDFNTEGKDLKYKITRISDYSVAVLIKGIKSDEFTFNSAGDLNCIKTDYSYNIYNYTVSFQDPIVSNSPSELKLSVNFKDIVLNSTGFLTWNNTGYIIPNISGINYNNFTINITPRRYSTPTISVNFTFNYTLNGTLLYTQNYSQTINSISLTNFGNLSNTSAINFTLYDEINNSIIHGNIEADFNYLDTETFSTTATNTNNFSIAIFPAGASTTGDYTIFYAGTGYTERRYSETTAIYNNNTQLINLYLLETGLGGYVTFRLIDTYQNPLENVEGTMQKSIGGLLVTVEQQTSDGSGIMSFFVNPDDDYIFTFTKTGYVSYTTTLRPITTEIYTITLEQEGAATVPPYSVDIRYSFSPSNTVLNNNTNYNFTYNLTSNYWDITECTLDIRNDTDSLTSSSSSFTARNCYIRIEASTQNQTAIVSKATYVLDDDVTETHTQRYTVKNTYKGEFSLMNFIDDIRAFGGAGFNDFSKMLIAFIIIFSIAAYGSSQFTGLRNPETLIMLVWGLVFLFSYVGFFTMAGMPSVWLDQYIIFILFTLGSVSYIIRRHI